MLQAYATNQTLTTASPVPFTSVSLLKGCTATLSGSTSIHLNKTGVYMVSAIVEGTPTAAGTASIGITQDGIAMPQATASVAPAATTIGVTLPVITLVQVNHDNGPRCCQAPTTLQVVCTGVGLTSASTSVVVTKVC